MEYTSFFFGQIHFQFKGCLVDFSIITIIEIPVLNANSEVSDQTPRFAASALGFHCL